MKRKLTLVAIGAGLLLSPRLATAQKAPAAPQPDYNTKTWEPGDATRIVQEVRHRLLTLSNYNVFDSLSFAIKGRTIILRGYASRPILKSDAEGAVKGIAGVTSVDNQIKVLPLSTFDDNIRVGVYRRIYGQAMLRKYTGSPVGFGMGPSVALAAGGITNDPPRGYHAIHIVVNRGHVTLTGVVDNEADANVASMQANATPGVFSVDNELMFPQGEKAEK